MYFSFWIWYVFCLYLSEFVNQVLKIFLIWNLKFLVSVEKVYCIAYYHIHVHVHVLIIRNMILIKEFFFSGTEQSKKETCDRSGVSQHFHLFLWRSEGHPGPETKTSLCLHWHEMVQSDLWSAWLQWRDFCHQLSG